MNNFGRALRLGLRYKWTLAGSIFCSLMVAVLWGGNIGTLYPVVEVVFKGQSIAQWTNERIAHVQGEIANLQTELNGLKQKEQEPPQDGQPTRQREACELRLADQEKSLARYQWLKPYADRYLPSDPFATLAVVIGLLVAGTLVKDLFLVAGELLVERITQLVTLDLRQQFYRRTLRLDLVTFGTGQSDLTSRFTGDVSCISAGVQIFYGRALREPLKVIVCLAGAAFISWRLLILSLLVVPVALLLINSLSKSLKRASRRAMEDMSNLYNILVETFTGIKIVKAFTMEPHERRRFHLCSKQYFHKSMRIALYNSLVRPTTELMGILMISLAILAGAYLVLNQQTHLLGIKMSNEPLTLSWLLVFYAMLAGVSDPTRKIADVYGQLLRGAAASDRVYEMLDREPQVTDSREPLPLPRHSRDLVLEHVDFHYHADQPVLRDVNLRIRAGETIAIVGPNGCGKSTLANLVLRFFDPTEGSVKLDGIDLRQVRRRDLRGQIGLVTQESLLFDDTVLNNIRYGTPGATEEEVMAAARQAHAHRFITEQLTDGYHTRVGTAGSRLSGGQRQRIALARAILRDPAILILDEATSQVDLESEQLIQKVLAQFVRGRTTLIITHRLGVLDLADRILVMDAGRVVDIGPHDELLARCELYSRLYRSDFRQSA